MRYLLAFPLAAGLMVLAAHPAAAQTRTERPYRGLFGGGVGNAQQLLTFNGSLGAGYATSTATRQTDPAAPEGSRVRRNTTFEQGSAGLGYSLSRSRLELTGRLGTNVAYYPKLSNRVLWSNTGSLGGNLQIAKRTSVMFMERATYEPLYFFAPFVFSAEQASQALAFDEAVGATAESVLTTNSTGTFQQGIRLTRRISGALNYAYTRARSSFGDRDLSTHSGGGRLNFSLARGLGARVGYTHSVNIYERADTRLRVDGDTLDAGLDLNRAISLSRRLTLAFATGIAGVKSGTETRYALVGSARLNREIGRTWNAGLAYVRNVGFIETFQKPVFSDALTADLKGLINRRLQFQSAAGAATGTIGFNPQGNGFRTYYGSATLNFGMTRMLGVGTAYSYYRNVFGRSVDLPVGLLRRSDSQSIRGFLSVWVPLVYRARRSDASR